MSVTPTKQTLRTTMRTHRQAQSPEDAHRLSMQVQAAVLTEPAWQHARQVILYMPVRGEVATQQLLDEAWHTGRQVLLPRCRIGGQGQVNQSQVERGHMDFVPCTKHTEMQCGAFGILEPAAHIPPLPVQEAAFCPDIVLIPGIAFDSQGYRLGFGGGYYDRALALPEFATARRIGLAYAWQIVAHIPRDVWDCPMHAVCTEEGCLWL